MRQSSIGNACITECDNGGLELEQLFTLKRAARVLAVSPEFLHKLRRQGRLRIVRLGRAVRITERELVRLCREELAK